MAGQRPLTEVNKKDNGCRQSPTNSDLKAASFTLESISSKSLATEAPWQPPQNPLTLGTKAH